MKKKRSLAVSLCTAVLLGGTAAPAFAGEITGTGESLKPLSAKSVCAFSGLNDEYVLGDTSAPRTQSWGSLSKETRDFLTGLGYHPGQACNAHLHPYDSSTSH